MLQPAPAPALLACQRDSGGGGTCRSLQAPVKPGLKVLVMRAKMPEAASCPLSNPKLPNQARESNMTAAVGRCGGATGRPAHTHMRLVCRRGPHQQLRD